MSPTASLVPSLAGTWSVIPSAPIQGRLGNSTIWTGTEMIVWGGQTGPATVTDRRASDGSDGAAYNPATRRWRTLSAPPIAGRSGHVAAWTGREMLVWGGARTSAPYRMLFDGAAYDPRTNTWRTLPPSPLRAQGASASVWTGSLWVIVSGRRESGPAPVDLQVAAYDPQRNTWRALPGLRVATDGSASISWTGSDLLLVENSDQSVAHGFRLRPGDDHWRPIAPAPFDGLNAGDVGDAVWTGVELAIPVDLKSTQKGIPPYRVFAYNPRTDTWRASPFPPFWDGSRVPIWTGKYLILGVGNQPSAVYEPEADRWLQLPAFGPGFRGFDVIWTGHRLLAWGGGEGESFTLPVRGSQFAPSGW